MLRMLQNKKTQKLLLKILLLVIGPPFVFWGIGSAVREKKETNRLKIYGKTIPERRFSESYKAVYMQAQMQFGDSFPEAQKFLDFKKLNIQRLILIEEAARRNIRVSDAEVARVITSDPSFIRKGSFDSKMYEQFTREVLRMNPRQYEELVRQDLMLGKLRDEVTKPVTVTDEEIVSAYRKENDQVSVSYIAAVPSELQKGIEPTEQELKAYFEANQAQFKVPLSVNLEYLEFDSEAKAADAVKKLKSLSAASVAGEAGVELKETGLFGQADPIPGIGWSRQLSSLIPGLKLSEALPPLKMDQRYFAFKVKEKKDAFIPDPASITEKIRSAFLKQRGEELARARIEQCGSKLKESSASFETVAKELSVRSGSTDLFNYNSYLEGIGVAELFHEKALALAPGQVSDVIELPSGLYIIKLKEKKTFADEEFAKAKEGFAEKVLQTRKQEEFGKFVEMTAEKALR